MLRRKHKRLSRQESFGSLSTTPESLLENQLMEAAEEGDLKTVKDLCENKGVSVNTVAKLNNEKLGYNKSTVKCNEKNGVYETALSIAIRCGQNEVASYLLQHQADAEQIYPFNPTKFYYFSKRRTPAYTESLLGVACYSPMSNEVFSELLKNIKNLNPPVMNYSGLSGRENDINLIELIYNEFHSYGSKYILTTDAAIRLTLMICEGMLRFDDNVLNAEIKFKSFLSTKELEAYLSNITLDDTQVAQLNKSIHLLVMNKSISIQHADQFTQMIKETVAKQRGCFSTQSTLSSTCSIFNTMGLNRDTDETASDSEEAEIKSPFHLSPTEEISALKRENRELVTQIEKLKEGQNELKVLIENLTKQMGELMGRDELERQSYAKRIN